MNNILIFANILYVQTLHLYFLTNYRNIYLVEDSVKRYTLVHRKNEFPCLEFRIKVIINVYFYTNDNHNLILRF